MRLAKQNTPQDELLRTVQSSSSQPNDFKAILIEKSRKHKVALLAEIKRASPSKGHIANVDPVAQAITYALAGAATISVLTEPHWFKGSLHDLAAVRAALNKAGLATTTCVLRKDFIIDEYQLLEARSAGADTALLIVASLSPEELARLMAFSRNLGMEPLVEVATEGEMRTALAANASVIGINNRDLHTMEVDMSKTARLCRLVPANADIVILSLSGVATRADVESFIDAGASGILVGESLMRAPSPPAFIREILALPHPRTLCKICGVRDAEAATWAVDAGADFIGMIFAPSKRKVTEEEAQSIVRAVRKRRPRQETWVAPSLSFRPVDGQDDVDGMGKWFEVWSLLFRHATLLGGPLTVGVFVDATVEEMNGVAERVGLDIIQLHGSEGWKIAHELVRPTIRVMHMDPGVDSDAVLSKLEAGYAAAALLDSRGGGTGKAFNWKVGVDVQARAPFILAGGLTVDNVSSAIQQVKPWCVDVSSGVESDGVKNRLKIEAFVRNAREAL